MDPLSAQSLSDVIVDFLQRTNPTLFAGSGVGAHAGLPTWEQYMELLAVYAHKYDPDTANLIRKRFQKGYFLEATSVYKSCPDIPDREKYKGLALPFDIVPNANKLQALISLPFFAVITTNYDRSIHDAYAKVYGRAPYTVELYDSTLPNALYRREFYIARIHGRAEVPKEMVIDSDDYKELLRDENYIDYMVNTFAN